MSRLIFGESIRRRLKEVGMQQVELAERLGINKNTLHNNLYADDIHLSRLVQISEALRYNFVAEAARTVRVSGVIDYKETEGLRKVSIDIVKDLENKGYPVNKGIPTDYEVWLWLVNVKGVIMYPTHYPAAEPEYWACFARTDGYVGDWETFGKSETLEDAIHTAVEYIIKNDWV